MTLEEAKAYLRIETADEDAVIGRLVASAQALCEAFTGRVLVRRAITETLRASGAWQRLGSTPVAAVTSVTDENDLPLPVDAYAVDIDPDGDGWVKASGGGRVRVSYTAGIAETAGGVPAGIAQGVTRLAAHLYVHRDDLVGPPSAVAALWRPFRRLRLEMERRP